MIRKIGISNFKPFGTMQTGDLAPLTLIYGPNSGGKSSLIQSLLLLKQSFADQFSPEYPLMPRGDAVDLGSFKSLLHRHELDRELSIELSYTPTDSRPNLFSRFFSGRRTILPSNGRSIGMGFKARPQEQPLSERPQLSSLKYEIGSGIAGASELRVELQASSRAASDLLGPIASEKELAVFEWSNSESVSSYGRFLFGSEELRPEFDRLWSSSAFDIKSGGKTKRRTLSALCDALSSSYVAGRSSLPHLLYPKPSRDDPSSKIDASWTFAPGLELFPRELRELLRTVEYLGPMRSAPERHYFLGNAHSDNVGKKGENTPQMLFYGSTQVKDSLNAWLELFDIPYKVTLRSFGDEVVGEMIVVNLNDLRNGTKVTPSDVGFGIGQLLPVLVQGIVSASRVLCVEQPEIHLHPRLQGSLADFFLWSSGVRPSADRRIGARKSSPNQWIVETHSEALLLRLLTRIREGSVKPDDVSVLYVNPLKAAGAEILRLRIDEAGHFIDEWPQGCFEESFQELFS